MSDAEQTEHAGVAGHSPSYSTYVIYSQQYVEL